MTAAVGSAWEREPWTAVQRAVWESLRKVELGSGLMDVSSPNSRGGPNPARMSSVRLALGTDPHQRPFRFHRGDRVLVPRTRAPWDFGVIVGGVYEGPPPETDPGYYRITYWIRRDDGELFEADEFQVRPPLA
jgi:hypothetical protein